MCYSSWRQAREKESCIFLNFFIFSSPLLIQIMTQDENHWIIFFVNFTHLGFQLFFVVQRYAMLFIFLLPAAARCGFPLGLLRFYSVENLWHQFGFLPFLQTMNQNNCVWCCESGGVYALDDDDDDDYLRELSQPPRTVLCCTFFTQLRGKWISLRKWLHWD